MAAFIALLIGLGIISSSEQATQEVVDQYRDVVGTDIAF